MYRADLSFQLHINFAALSSNNFNTYRTLQHSGLRRTFPTVRKLVIVQQANIAASSRLMFPSCTFPTCAVRALYLGGGSLSFALPNMFHRDPCRKHKD